MIVGQNALLNQYVPTFYIKDLRDGQGVIYDSVRKAFVNSEIIGSGGADRLGELLDVADSVDNPLSLQNGQALVYNTFTQLWENVFVDYNTLLNKPTIDTLLPTQTGNAGKFLTTDGTLASWSDISSVGTVTSVAASGGSTGLAFSGSPITTSGTLTLSGTLSITNGGTGQTTASGAINALVPAQTGNTGKFLSTNGSIVSWQTLPGSGTVTSVAVSGANGIGVSGSPITTSGTINLTLGAITPTSVSSSGIVTGTNISATGTISGSNFSGTSSGTNTGDQTITLTGDVTGTGSGSFTTTLSTVNSNVGTFGSSTQVPVITVDGKGRVTAISTVSVSAGSGTVTSVGATGGTTGMSFSGTPITTSGVLVLEGTLGIANGGTGSTSAQTARNALLPTQAGNSGRFLTSDGTNVSWAVISGSGTVTSVAVTGNNGISVSGSPITTSGTFTLGLGAITPTSVAASGTVTGSNLSGTHSGTSSGTNTGNQVIVLSGDATNSNTSTGGVLTLSTVNGNVGTFGSATQVPVFTVNAKGLITGVTNTTITGGGVTSIVAGTNISISPINGLGDVTINASGGSGTPEIVVFKYSAGGVGNLTPVDAIVSQTSGVTATITDGANCVVSYSFTGKSNPPKSITVYGQIFNTNTFRITAPYTATTTTVLGGGVNTAPDLANGIFSAANTISIQSRPSDTGAVGAVGQRAWLVVEFGF